jgi:hypothetical protein
LKEGDGEPGKGDDVEDGDDHFLPKGEGDEAGPGGEEIGAGGGGHGDGGGKGARGVDGIGVGEEEPLAGGGLRELMAGPVLARPAAGERGAGEEAMPGIGRR